MSNMKVLNKYTLDLVGLTAYNFYINLIYF